MSAFHIDRLLDTVIRQEASDLHLTVGQPPVGPPARAGSCGAWKTRKVLEPEDTTALMKSITPERNQQRDPGGGLVRDFGFAFGDMDDPDNSARFRVSVFRQKGQHWPWSCG